MGDSDPKGEATPQRQGLRGPSLPFWVGLLTTVSVLGFVHWKIAAYLSARKLGLAYDSLGVVETARIVPNASDTGVAALGLFVTFVSLLIGCRSVSSARRTSFVLGIIISIATMFIGWSHLWRQLLLMLCGAAVGGVVGWAAGIDINTTFARPGIETASTPGQEQERHRALAGWLISLCLIVGGQATLIIAIYTPVPVVVVFLPEQNRDVSIVRSDHAGHLALDDDGRLMWLSRSKVPEIRGRLVDKKK